MDLSIKHRVRWENFRTPRSITALIVGSAAGAGLFPIAPGTMGTLFGMPLAYLSATWDWQWRVLLWTVLFAAGTWAARVFDEVMGTSDNQTIVMDEVVGLGITAWTCGQDWKLLWIAFGLFRLFDVMKFPPVRQIDRWSKKKASEKGSRAAAWWGGFGVMGDDLLAGFQGLFVIWILQVFHIL